MTEEHVPSCLSPDEGKSVLVAFEGLKTLRTAFCTKWVCDKYLSDTRLSLEGVKILRIQTHQYSRVSTVEVEKGCALNQEHTFPINAISFNPSNEPLKETGNTILGTFSSYISFVKGHMLVSDRARF